eukprot:11170409-Lingulodinium_polyedra.AAC.1
MPEADPRTGGGRRAEPNASFLSRVPHGVRVAWISTRRAAVVAHRIAGNVIGRYTLHDTLADVTAS